MQEKPKLPKWLNQKTIGILISIVFLFLIFHNINFKQVIESMKSFNILYAIPAIVTYALSYIVRSFRWKHLLLVSKNIPFLKVLKALYIGYMANNLLPARMGELYRAHVIGKDQNIKASGALASIVAERIFDGLILFLLLIILTSFFHNSAILVKISITTGIIFLGSFLVLLYVSRSTHNNFQLLFKLIKFFPDIVRKKVEAVITSFIRGLGVIRSFKSLGFILLTSATAWFLEWTTMFIIVSGFDLPVKVEPVAIAFLVVLVAFSTMIPSGPAFVGPYQYAFILALDMINIGKDTALAIAVTTQFVMMAPVIIIGMILLWKSHLKLGDIPEENNNNTVESEVELCK